MASGVELATAYVSLTVEASKIAPETAKQFGAVERQAAKSGKASSNAFGSSFKTGVGTAVKAGVLALAGVAAGGIAFARSSIAEARESQKVGALTENVIKSTGGAAKITAAQVGDLATAISNKTGIDDEAIQSGANMLLTFKNIRNEAGKGNDIFNQSTSILTDLATAMGSDPQKAAIQLGKALNDPVKGVAALGRVGVTFNDTQKKTIKSLVDGGKTAEAQKIILKELNSEFGGAAAASATAGEKMSTAFGNFKESIGTALLPVLDKAEGFITNKVIPALSDFLPKAIATVSTALSNMKDAFTFGSDWESHSPLESFAVGARAVYDVITGKIIPAVQNFIAEFKNGEGAGGKFRDVLEKTVTVARDVAKWIGDNATIVQILAGALGGGLIAFQAITTAVKIYTGVQAILNAVMSANPIGVVIIAIAALVAGIIVAYKKSETFRNIVKGAFDAIGAAARFMWNNVVAPVIRFLLDAFTKVTSFYATLLRGLSKIPGFGWAKGAADALQNVANKAAGIKDAIHDIPSRKDVTINVSARVMTGRIKVGNESVNVGMRASGGPVTAGRPYIVGENEPELFVPRQSGTIYNQRQIAAAGGSGITQTNHFHGITDAQTAAAASANRLKFALRTP